MADAPKRRLHLTLDLGADTLDEIYHALRSIADNIDHQGAEERDWLSGGAASGWHLRLTVTDPDMTPERYYEALKAWVDARRASTAAAAVEQ